MNPKYVWMRPLLGSLVTIFMLVLTGYLTYKSFDIGWDAIPKELLVLYVALVQAMILSHKDGFGFYFGTSQGSANKSDTIDELLNGGPSPHGSPVSDGDLVE